MTAKLIPHGTQNGYGNYGCRCAACSKANSEYQRAYFSRPCAGGCGGGVYGRYHPGRMCRNCAAKRDTTTVRPDELLCTTCGEWKPDGAFPHGTGTKVRRGRHSDCRICATVIRRAYRERRKQPCVHCGAPALPASEKTTNGGPLARCRPCFLAELHGRLSERMASLERVTA